MKKLLIRFNSSLHRPKAFWIGILYMFFFVFILIGWFFFGEDFFRANGTKSGGSDTHPIILLFFTIPGILVLIYSLKPNSKLGNLGKYCFKFLSSILK